MKAKHARVSGKVLPMMLGQSPGRSKSKVSVCHMSPVTQLLNVEVYFQKKRMHILDFIILIQSGSHMHLFILNFFRNKEK